MQNLLQAGEPNFKSCMQAGYLHEKRKHGFVYFLHSYYPKQKIHIPGLIQTFITDRMLDLLDRVLRSVCEKYRHAASMDPTGFIRSQSE